MIDEIDELGIDLEKAKKIESYANSILGFCSDGSNNTLDVALILALASAKMLKVFRGCVDEDDNIESKDKKAIKDQFEYRFAFFINKFQNLLNGDSK